MINKKILALCFALYTPTYTSTASAGQALGVLAAVATGFVTASWVAGRCICPLEVHNIERRYAPECTALDSFGALAVNGYGWNATFEHQLRQQIKNYAVQFHNVNRNKWRITVLFEHMQGLQTGYISGRYYNYPLLNYMNSLNSAILNLRITSALRLYGNRELLWRLINQLIYIRDLLLHDDDLVYEQQRFEQETAAGQAQY